MTRYICVQFLIYSRTSKQGTLLGQPVLIPGAGLGRLAYEIARIGYTSQGNEFSMHMLFGSNFILNWYIHPLIHTVRYHSRKHPCH